MGSTHLLIFSPFPLYQLFLNPSKTLQNPKFYSKFCCSSSSKPNWGSNSDAYQRRRFEFGRRKKRSNWWSDDDDVDEEDDDYFMEFGFWEETSTGINWFFKIFKAFGWMVPAIMISTLLGTGTNSLIMAVVLPLGQTALSLVMDKLWGDPGSIPNVKPRYRSRSKLRSRSKRRSRSERKSSTWDTNPLNVGAREVRSRTPPVNVGYQSWAPVNYSSTTEGGGSGSKFGGWDELDQQVASSNNFTERKRQTVDGLQRGFSETGKLSTQVNRDKPLFFRLLIAMFPILGSWTRFLF